jgi:hypothetical protein
MIIPLGVVMTLPWPAATDIDAVGPVGESPEYKSRINPARAHEPDDLYVSGILKT